MILQLFEPDGEAERAIKLLGDQMKCLVDEVSSIKGRTISFSPFLRKDSTVPIHKGCRKRRLETTGKEAAFWK
jgi:hypothetical protein